MTDNTTEAQRSLSHNMYYEVGWCWMVLDMTIGNVCKTPWGRALTLRTSFTVKNGHVGHSYKVRLDR